MSDTAKAAVQPKGPRAGQAQDTSEARRVEGSADITAAFLLLLGRQPSPPSVFDVMKTMTLTGMLHRISGGSEFRDKVLAPLLSGRPLPHERSHRSPAAPLLEWLCERLDVREDLRERLGRTRDWRELLTAMARDEALAAAVFAPSIRARLAAVQPQPGDAAVPAAGNAPAPPPAREPAPQAAGPSRPAAREEAPPRPAGPQPAAPRDEPAPPRAAAAADRQPPPRKDPPKATAAPAPPAPPPAPSKEPPKAAAATPPPAPPPAPDPAPPPEPPPPLPGDVPGRLAYPLSETDAARLLLVTLGRIEPKPATITPGRPLSAALFRVLHSGDFDERVLGTMIERGLAPQDMEHPRPERALVRWAAERLPVSEQAVGAILAAESYRDLLAALLADEAFLECAFPPEADRRKMPYLRQRAAGAVAASRGRADPALPVLRDIAFSPDPPALTGTVAGAVSDAAEIVASLDGPSSFEAPGRLLRDGGRLAFAIPLPERMLDGQNWFARLTLRDGERVAPGARRFSARAGQRAAAPGEAAPAAAILGIAGRVVVASADPGLPLAALRLSVAGEMLPPAATVLNEADAAARLAFLVPPGLADAAMQLVLRQPDAEAKPLSAPAPCTTAAAGPARLAVGAGLALSVEHADPWALAGLALEMDGAPLPGCDPRPAAEPLLAPFGLSTRVAFALPPAALDGAPHSLVVRSGAADGADEVGRLSFAFDTPAVTALLASAGDEAQRALLLDRAADLGRLDLLADALAEVVLGEGEAPPPGRTLALIAKAFSRRPVESMDHALRRLFDLLWRQAARTGGDVDQLFAQLADSLMRAGDADERRILHATRLKDAAVDLLLARWKADPKGVQAARIAGPLLSLGRPGLAELVLADGLKTAPANPDLLALRARLLLLRGEEAPAAQAIEEALAAKPEHAEALSLRARLLQAQGDHLGALALATGQRGLTAVGPGGAAEARHARQALPLGWLHWSRRAFDADPGGEIATRLDAAIALQGGPLPASERGFSVLYLPPQLRKGGLRGDFFAYGADCLMVTLLDDTKLGAAPVIGPWALFLAADRRLAPQAMGAVLAERRPGVGVIRLLQPGGAEPSLCGLLVRAEHVIELGHADLAQSDALLRDRLRATSLLLPG